MRIFVVCGDRGVPPDGTKGASVHLRSLSVALAGLGHDVVAFTARPGDFPLPRRDLADGALAREARGGGPPDVVYERCSLGHPAGLAAARALGRPLLLEVNAPLVDEARRFRPATVEPAHVEAEHRLLREADVVLPVSGPLRDHVALVRGYRPTVVVPNGCDPALFPVPAALDGDPVLVFLGHPKPWHGAERLPPMLAELRRRGVAAHLLVVGGGPGADDVLASADAAGVAPFVTVTGPLPHAEAARRLLDSAVAVAPYPPDPFFYFSPLKVVECMAAGLPVVTTGQGDLPGLVGDGGAVVPPGDDAGFLDAVHRLLVDGERRLAAGRRARARALEHHTWDAVARRVTAVAHDAIGVPA